MDTLNLYEDSVTTVVKNNVPIVKIVDDCKKFLVFHGVEIPVNNDTLEQIEELKYCDGLTSSMVFYGCQFSKKMFEAGLIGKNVRGSYYSTALFKDVFEQLCEKTKELYNIDVDTQWTPTPENIDALPAPIREYINTLKRMHD